MFQLKATISYIVNKCTNVYIILLNTITYLQYFNSLKNFIKYKDTSKCDIYLKKLEKSLYNCGPIGIKLVQNIIMYDGLLQIESINTLKYTLEQCKIHSWNETSKLYYNNYGRNINEDFEINEFDLINKSIIGSGSIGQVYKLYSKKYKKYVAVKVKHPNVDVEINQFIIIANFIIKYISYVINIPHKKTINIFIDNIRVQKDFINEANNTIKFRNNFKDDNVTVPEIFDYKNDFIIMSYHNGISVNTIESNLKYAIYSDFIFILITSMIIHNFIHCDLHDGNWKIELLENNKYNIIIYDCGLVVSTKDVKLNQKLITSMLIADYKEIAYSLTNDKNKIQNYINYIDEINVNYNISASERVNNILKYAVEQNIVHSRSCINLLLSNIMTSTISKINTEKLQKVICLEEPIDKGIIINIYLGILQKTNTFINLKDFLIDYVDKNKECKDFYKEWLLNTFGHTDSDIIIDLIYKYFYSSNE